MFQQRSAPPDSGTQPDECHIHLIAAHRHELVPGGVPLTRNHLALLDEDARHWIEECDAEHRVFVVPAAGEEAADAGGALDRPAHTVLVSTDDYRELMRLQPR